MQKITFLFNVPSQYLKTGRTNVFITVTCRVYHEGSELKAALDNVVAEGIDFFDSGAGSTECIDIVKAIAIEKYQESLRPNTVQISEKAAA